MFEGQPNPGMKTKQVNADICSVTSSARSNFATSDFPQRWHLHKTKNGKLRSDLNIGSDDGAILNAVSTRLGWRSGVAIYLGQDKDSEFLATAKISTRSLVVSLPGLAAYNQEIKMKSHGWKTVAERVEWQMPVGIGQHVERFEWASSSGSWKLTRRGSNGDEVVARWSVSLTSTRLNGEFEFVGAGATGELGEAFSYVASVSALAIAKLMRDTAQSYAGGAIAGASAAAAS